MFNERQKSRVCLTQVAPAWGSEPSSPWPPGIVSSRALVGRSGSFTCGICVCFIKLGWLKLMLLALFTSYRLRMAQRGGFNVLGLWVDFVFL